ncbi:hypothetical protein V2J09_012492 [Rumex salicifolius]
MFDWEDQELAIIWGETDDHIVPYPEESERKSQPFFMYHDNNEAQEEPSHSKLSEQNPDATKIELHGGKPECNDDLYFAASDLEQNCIGKEVDLEKGSQISKDHNEIRELNDIISNSWANIGSFDDLDRIFSDDNVDHASLDGTWLPPEINVQIFDSQSFPDSSKSYSSSVLDHEKIHHQSTYLPYQQISNPYFPAYSYGNRSDHCTSMSVFPGTDDEHHPVLSNVEVCLSERVSIDKSTDTLMKSQNMTPQEKIEKLRRRQQMRALLPIKKQQQQLSHSVPITDYSTAQKSSEDNKVLHFVRTDLEGAENMDTICDPSSPLKQDGVSMEMVDHNVEHTVLYQLQDAISKLDTNTRLCIRDSLFRLTQSATQRNYASDAISTSRHGDLEAKILKENISNQESLMERPSAETKTNGIDRALAHLLFHQPLKSISKQTGTPVSSISSRNPPSLEISASSIPPLSFVTKSSVNEHNISTHGSNSPCPINEPHPEDLPQQPQTDASMDLKMKQKMLGDFH